MLKGRLLQALVALILTAAAHNSVAAENLAERAADEQVVASISGAPGKLGREESVPNVLSTDDAARYRTAFDLQDRGQWAAADREIARIQDRLLLGHLLAQRYLSGAFHVQAEDLREWMARYADLPEADDIYDLAKRRLGRRIASVKPPAHPLPPEARSRDDDPSWEDFAMAGNRQLSPRDSRRLQALKARFRTEVHHGDLDAAASALTSSTEMRHIFENADYDELKTVLAMGYFAAGRDADAQRWAEEAADRSGDVLPEAHWVAGLSMWRQGEHAAAAHHFEAVANATDISSWLLSAGAYWAARANLAGRHPEVVNHWLQQAAAYPRTFYGLLARRALGQGMQYSWEFRPFTDLDAEVLEHIPGTRRALALLQLGDHSRAEDELRRLVPSAGPSLTQSMFALSHAGGLPALAVWLSNAASARDGRIHDSAEYPLPEWRPIGGWSVDRALVLAIARQESSFNPKAKSPCGAIGLMQLMPRTARSMGRHGRLTDPAVNLEVGQRYVRHLLDDDTVKGNLMFLAASYNSGPANVARWLQNMHHDGDALLFMESIPVRETRVFVERVMTNFWAYRDRLGLSSPSLDAIAGGDWPMYDGAGAKLQTVSHVKN